MATKKRVAKKRAQPRVSKTTAKKRAQQPRSAAKKLKKRSPPKPAKKRAARGSDPKRGPLRKKAATRRVASLSARKEAARKIAVHLARAIPQPHSELRFHSAFELLIATMLAAQSTDRTVNDVMPVLLARWPDARALASANQSEVETVVFRTGFFRNKAKSIRETSALIVAQHAGEVPRTMEELVALPGVARKTANVVLGSAFGLNLGFIVDTHVLRVSERLRLTGHAEPVKVEHDLCALFPQSQWTDFAHRLTLHGRYTCLARAPKCELCPLNELCESRQAPPEADVSTREHDESVRVHSALAYMR